jgi:hypothetical protein
MQRGGDAPAPARQRSEWHGCAPRVAALPDPLLAGQHQSLTGWRLWRYGLGLNGSHAPMAPALALQDSAGEQRTPARRDGLVKKRRAGRAPTRARAPQPRGEPALQGHPQEARARGAKVVDTAGQAQRVAAPGSKQERRSWG